MRIKVNPARESADIVTSITQIAFPQMMITSLFVMKYSYKIKNYSVPEDEKEKELLPPELLSKTEKLDQFITEKQLHVNGWDVYNWNKEFKRQGVVEAAKFRQAK